MIIMMLGVIFQYLFFIMLLLVFVSIIIVILNHYRENSVKPYILRTFLIILGSVNFAFFIFTFSLSCSLTNAILAVPGGILLIGLIFSIIFILIFYGIFSNNSRINELLLICGIILTFCEYLFSWQASWPSLGPWI